MTAPTAHQKGRRHTLDVLCRSFAQGLRGRRDHALGFSLELLGARQIVALGCHGGFARERKIVALIANHTGVHSRQIGFRIQQT